jgi:twinkle protein
LQGHAHQPASQDVATREILRASDFEGELLGLYERGFTRGLSTGWQCVDEFFRLRHGEVTVITGIPGHGKSSWLDNLMVNTARSHGWRWVVFSAENYPIARHVAGLAEIYAGKPFNRGRTDRMTTTELKLSLSWLGRHFGFIQPREGSYNLNHIVKLAAASGELDALVIDPWNELDQARPRDQREDEFISVGLSRLRWLARTAHIHVVVVAHPAKYQRKDGEKKPVITLNDVKGASEWYAKADNGISVWRDEGDPAGPTEVHIQKIRFREVGHIGMCRLFYDRVSGRFTDPNHRPTIDELIAKGYGREPGDEDEEQTT